MDEFRSDNNSENDQVHTESNSASDDDGLPLTEELSKSDPSSIEDPGSPDIHAAEGLDSSDPPTRGESSSSEPPGEDTFVPPKLKPWIIRIIIVVLVLIAIRWLINWIHNYSAKTSIKPVPVVLSLVKKMDMPLYIPALGTVIPLETVTVKTQVNGVLQKVLFKEGQKVSIGELLAEIDPRPFEAQLAQFQGQLARDQALLANAKIDLDRYEKLFKQDSVSQQTLETQRWLVKQLEGTIKLDQGQVDAALVNLAYTRITSPIDGQVGLRLVDPGNFVQTSDTTGIVVINTVQPITVVFAIPEDNIPEVMRQFRLGKDLIVEAYDRAQNRLLATGTVLTVDNQIDTTTGTVKIKAKFNNEDKTLFPNQFVNVQLKVLTLENATVVPRTAIQYGASGTFVFVVNKKDKQSIVKVKPIVVTTMVKDCAAIIGELLPDQEVVVEGGDKLNDETVIKSEPRSTNHSNGNGINKTLSSTKNRIY